jgi:2,4-diketo-3-deoxy-L-fuconate hydrolase
VSTVTWSNVVPGGFGLARVQTPAGPDTLVVIDGAAVSLADLGVVAGRLPDWTVLLKLWDDTLDRISSALKGRKGSRPVDSGDLLSPLASPQIFQAAANYRKHVIDLMVASPRPEHAGADEPERRRIATALMDQRAASGTPTVFAGMPSSLTGAHGDVMIPHITQKCDWELELAIVIGRTTRYATADTAMHHIAGYTIANDISMRDHLYPSGDSSRGGDWLACKGAPTFLPVGPIVVPARFVPDPQALTITLELNGEIMQNEAAADMIFGIPRLVEHTSKYVELRPGDLLLTGSPAGNGVHHGRFLKDGDVMTGRITGLGIQRTPVVDEVLAPQ